MTSFRFDQVYFEADKQVSEMVENESKRFATGKSQIVTCFTDDPLEQADHLLGSTGRASTQLPTYVSEYYQNALTQIDPETHEL